MKKVIFILAFMLMGTYANATTENPIIDNTKTELIKSDVFNDLSVVTINNSNKSIGTCSYSIEVVRFYDTGPVSTTYYFTEETSSSDGCKLAARLKAFEIMYT
ncbi:hypothetical protein [Tenacibaculum bernardetii]|uniref:hypothetical protein n=1 Tax=Tenacibaculum bernardetii TaxID=3021375 RepID=UPI0023B12516|nr:hypothetical protein [Tenacibaculum bernardetii]